MVSNNYVLLLQCQIRGRHVLIDSFIAAEHFGWYLYRVAKHPQLLPKGFDELIYFLESNTLTLERAGLNSVLSLTIPYYGCLVKKY